MTTKFRTIHSRTKRPTRRKLMSQLGVIIHRPAGKPAPETAYLELALQNCSKVWGIAILADGKLDLNQGENPDLNLLTTTFEDFKDEALTIFLGDAVEG